jgi:hypothetical protein
MSPTLPRLFAVALIAASACLGTAVQAQSFFQGFNDATLPAGWVPINRSTAANTAAAGSWRTGTAIVDQDGNPVVNPHEGTAFALVSFQSTNSTAATGATISNWLLSPTLSLRNGDTFSFFTQTPPSSAFADRLELRLSLSGSSTDVGTTPQSVGVFTTLLLTVNPNLTVGGYPETWTQFTATITGLSGPTDGRFAFRYFVTDGGPQGNNSNIIGVDSVSYNAVPEPTTYALFAGGALILLAVARRQRGARADA